MIYEQRTYAVMPGRMPDLLRRFEEAVLPIWERHGIRQAGFWTYLVAAPTKCWSTCLHGSPWRSASTNGTPSLPIRNGRKSAA